MKTTLIDKRYRRLELLGEGAMGCVYSAIRVDLGTEVALKVLHPHVARDPGALARITREARAASAVHSPHVVRVRDVGDDAGVPYIAMERVHGPTLRAVLATEGAMEPARALDIAAQIAAGLAAAHDQGVIHRDLKPANVLLAGGDLVKIVDFGIAKLSTAPTRITATGQLLGSPAYMAPEQCAGADCDERSDVYALGVVLHEMLSGRHPFLDRDPIVLLHRHQFDEPLALSGAPASLRAVVERCMRKDPAERFASMVALGHALSEARAELVGALRPTRRILPVPARSRGPTIAIGLLTLAASLAFGVSAVHFARRCDPVAPVPAPTPRVAEQVLGVDASFAAYGAAPTDQVRRAPLPVAEEPAVAAPLAPVVRRRSRGRDLQPAHRSPLVDPWR